VRRALVLCLVLAACGGDDAAGPDAEVCDLPAAGTCDGNVVSRCDGAEVVTQDCGEDLEACVFLDDEQTFGCADLCDLPGGPVDTPVCRDGAVVSCSEEDGHHVPVIVSCGVGTVCDDSNGAGACVADPCSGIGPQGKCAGETFTACVGGAAAETDCTATGDVCAYVDDATGYACVAPATVGAMAVAGIARYEDRAPQVSGALAAIAPLPIRGAVISVIRDTDSVVLDTAIVADDGSYVLRYDATLGELVHVTASSSSPLAIRPIRVRRTMTSTHGFGGASFAAATATNFDLLVTDSSGTSEAFNLLDQAIIGMDTIRAVFDDAAPPQLTVRWARGSNDGTYYGGNQIHLLGQTSDDDGYDDTVMLHEFGHYVEDVEGRSDNPGGGHDGSPDDPRLAWSEGFATYFAMMARGVPVYMDSNSGGGWGWNADDSITEAPMPTGPLDQLVSEDMIAENLWDLGDAGLADDDPMTSAGHTAVLQVQAHLRTGTLREVGHDGVDLVDALDGWFQQQGLSSCAPVRTVVTGIRKFPYDYAGPGGACP